MRLPILQVSFKSVYAKVFSVSVFVNVSQHRGRVWLLRLCLTLNLRAGIVD
jgi:hypothetical protein